MGSHYNNVVDNHHLFAGGITDKLTRFPEVQVLQPVTASSHKLVLSYRRHTLDTLQHAEFSYWMRLLSTQTPEICQINVVVVSNYHLVLLECLY